ncbi:MAG: metal ABC transporter permease [Phycisphaerales bacterium]|nr:MAG: metal ABC transporter permease [Phycisphaerales bacterium]
MIWLPFIACAVLTGIHCYLGLHVVMRGVIFVDLALAQIAAMGTAVGLICGLEPGSIAIYLVSLVFTFVGAAVFSLARFKDHRVPQEAMIGITYAVSTAVTLLILSKSAVETEQLKSMLEGELLFVTWPQVYKTLVIYGGVGLIHWTFRRPFFAISRDHGRTMTASARRGWDFLFYMTFGLVVTSSVQIAGVLLVFSFLVAPAVCAMMFFDSATARLLTGWSLGMIATVFGLTASWTWDLPPAMSIVAVFGAMVASFSAAYALVRRRRSFARPHPSDAPAGVAAFLSAAPARERDSGSRCKT